MALGIYTAAARQSLEQLGGGADLDESLLS